MPLGFSEVIRRTVKDNAVGCTVKSDNIRHPDMNPQASTGLYADSPSPRRKKPSIVIMNLGSVVRIYPLPKQNLSPFFFLNRRNDCQDSIQVLYCPFGLSIVRSACGLHFRLGPSLDSLRQYHQTCLSDIQTIRQTDQQGSSHQV